MLVQLEIRGAVRSRNTGLHCPRDDARSRSSRDRLFNQAVLPFARSFRSLVRCGYSFVRVLSRGQRYSVKTGDVTARQILANRRLTLAPAWITLPALTCTLILSACLMSVAIATGRHAWVGWVSLIPLFAVIRRYAPLYAMLCGALWGGSLGLFLVLGTPIPIEPIFPTLTLVILVPAAYAFLGGALPRRVGFEPFLLALGWVGVECALAPVGLRNGLLTGSQGEGVLVHALGSALGYGLFAFLVAYVNASLLSVFVGVLSAARSPTRGTAIADGCDRVREVVSAPDPNSSIRVPRPRGPPVVSSSTDQRFFGGDRYGVS